MNTYEQFDGHVKSVDKRRKTQKVALRCIQHYFLRVDMNVTVPVPSLPSTFRKLGANILEE